jgi:glycosyltransferase involved in cell wall biosynthesis
MCAVTIGSMPRLAWFSPVPPSRSGIAAYSEEILPVLAARWQIDVFTAPAEPGVPRPAGHPPVFEAHDFTWKHYTAPYDLVVYQLGNAMCHGFMWPYLFRHPGLVVLHDAQLHHARARALLAHGRVEDYRAEFHANHPGAPEDAPELVIRDLADASYYFWPMLRLVLRSSRHVAVHAPRLAESLSAEFGTEVDAIRMGVVDPRAADRGAIDGDPLEADLERRRWLRARYGLTPDQVVFAAVGLVTPEKRISPILSVLPGVLQAAPSTHLLLVGGAEDHYDAMAEARALGVADHVTLTGHVPDDEVSAHLATADVCLCLRWPSGRETSASWLRALATGRATVVINLAHSDEVAYYDPRTWTVEPAGSGDASNDLVPQPVCVGVDILDERHSLALAMSRLATDRRLRTRLGLAARMHWEQSHTLACMGEDYERVLRRALGRPAVPPRDLPAHLQSDGTALARRLLDEMGASVDFLNRRPLA